MSVAEQTATEKIPRSPAAQLAERSLLGACFLLGSLFLVFSLLPNIWHQMLVAAETGKEVINPFLSAALLFVLCVGAAIGIGCLGNWLDRHYHQPGVRAGSFFGAICLFIVAWIAFSLGNFLDEKEADFGIAVNLTMTLIVAGGVLFGVAWMFLQNGFRTFLIAVEEQGWFSTASFKPNQGHKVRRATIAGILTIGVCGIYTMVTHRVLGSGLSAANDWYWWLPFFTVEEGNVVKHYPIVLLYKVHLLVPLLLSLALLWFSYRIVNWPTFADFLIATEAEINKVSWTTRKRLVTDTIVVLTTVVFLTVYLFVVDILWIQALSNRIFPVLFVDIRTEQQKQLEKTLW